MSIVHYCCVCVGSSFHPEYVENLYNGIARNFSGEWDFTVICDEESQGEVAERIGITDEENLDRIRLVQSTLPLPPSWWHKLNLFRKDIWPHGEAVFYMDLDTIVIGSLDKLASRKGFNMLNWNGKWYPYGSGVMIFPAGAHPSIWEVWKGASEETLNKKFPKGDQQLIAESIMEWGIFPIHNDEAASYKRDKWHLGEMSADPKTHDASIICFHGKPRPHEINKGLFGYREWRNL